jgi:hypothetical protein
MTQMVSVAAVLKTADAAKEPRELVRDEDLLGQMGCGLGVYQVPNVKGDEETLE